jgi:trehalose/maltose hydrolase-like predicted phosphorylase
MGPDEFHEKYPDADKGGLKNNSYTNLMVAWILQRAFDLLEGMSASTRKALTEKIRLTESELDRWQEIAQKLYVSISSDGILEQFEGYFELKELDWAHYQHRYGNIHRMDRILKAEGESPDEYKVAKQADALMTFYLLAEDQVKTILNDLGYTPPESLLHDNFYYYLSRTSHGSTLSRLVHAYLAHILGDKNLSWQLYTEALKSDYIDVQGGTTKEGIHAGVMTGTVLFALRAYAGLDYSGETLKLNPNLPATWRSMRFGVDFKGDRYVFSITPETIKIKLEGSEEKSIRVNEKELLLQTDQWIEAS